MVTTIKDIEKAKKNKVIKLSKEVKVYAVGWGGDSFWLCQDDNFTQTKDITLSDLIILPGGADINPALYGEKAGKRTYFYEDTDKRQVSIFENGRKLGKKFFGICRGLQLLTAMAGGKLVQDISHPYSHRISTYDNKVFSTNSLHHQQAYLLDMPTDSYELLGWANRLSPEHLNGENKDMKLPKDYKEPEVVYYPLIESMGVQGHPEMSGMAIDLREWLIEQVKLKLFSDLIIK